MATVSNLVGFGSGGTEEALTVAGTPTVNTTNARITGGYSCELNDTSDDIELALAANGAASAGNNKILGFAIRFSDKIPSAELQILQMDDDSANTAARIHLKTDGDLAFIDDATTTLLTWTPTVDQWHYIEWYWEEASSGAYEIWIDGTQEASGTANLDATGAIDRYKFTGSAGATFRIADIYSMTGATAASDRLGEDVEVRPAYQNDVEDATDQGTALTVGTWGATAGVPFDTPGTVPGYEGAGAESGHTLTDNADSNARPGPSGDSGVSASGTIHAVKYMYGNMYRGNGGTTTHDLVYGHSGDTATATVDLSTTPTYYEYVIQSSASQAPTASEAGAIGFQKSAGAREIYCESLAIAILYTPPVGAPRRIFITHT